ncbi:type II toxin-antitoxin system RelE/ParE family toxin [Helicobacter enhydrae]|uniref:type II toxin-antitoxin system RelE/ParE family toxin n=1 Tax=Helicobacter enhydrae TaxID=222136 RepID=UPI0009FD5A84|nr:type II toxin-antitoxin system RelE/ParE family toxin [Helicobacter enhydrae]
MWNVEFVNEKAKSEFVELPQELLARGTRIIELLERKGNAVGEPHTKNIGDGLFEIRIKASNRIARSIYCYEVNKRIIVLLTFIKKSNKIPKNMLDLAKIKGF